MTRSRQARSPSWSAPRSRTRWRSRAASPPPAGRALVSRAEQPSDGLPARLPDGRPKGQALRKIIEALAASLGPGAPLPSERLLADRYGLARMTVRSEVDRLVAEGIVFRLHGRGSFVAEPRVAQAV